MKKFVFYFLFVASVLASCQGREVADGGPTDSIYGCFEDFAGHSVAVMTGSTHDLMFSSIEGVRVMRFDSMSDMIAAVRNGIVEYMASDEALMAGRDIADEGLAVAYAEARPGVETCAAFGKSNGQLRSDFNDFLREIKADGTYDDMISRWTGDDAQHQLMPQIELPSSPVRRIVIGVDPTAFPFTFVRNGALAGLEPEIIYRFAARMNYGVDFLQSNLASLIAAVSTEKVDAVLCCITATEERARQMLFSESYYPTTVEIIGALETDDDSVDESQTVWKRFETSFHNNLIVESRWKLIVEGLCETLTISVFAVLFGTMLGMLLCWLKFRRSRFSRKAVDIYVMLVQGIPMLVFLMFMFYVVFASSRVTATWVAIIAFSFNFAAFACELFVAGIAGIDRGQTEAGRALGFSGTATFLRIVAPQALRTVIPMYKGEVVSLVKNTSIVGYIAIQDLTKMSDLIRSRTFDAFFPLIIISVIYFVLAWLVGMGLDAVGRSVSPKIGKK